VTCLPNVRTLSVRRREIRAFELTFTICELSGTLASGYLDVGDFPGKRFYPRKRARARKRARSSLTAPNVCWSQASLRLPSWAASPQTKLGLPQAGRAELDRWLSEHAVALPVLIEVEAGFASLGSRLEAARAQGRTGDVRLRGHATGMLAQHFCLRCGTLRGCGERRATLVTSDTVRNEIDGRHSHWLPPVVGDCKSAHGL
jgi:hypothetical protein